jgi:hypothetical protein
MKPFRAIPWAMLLMLFSATCGFAQKNAALADNAALRYWSAFSQVQDTAISDQQAKELNAILDGTAPYDDAKYKDLIAKNVPALEVMLRGTTLPNCDWGLDYGLGENLPVDYARKALVLGRMNVLYALHLLRAGKDDEAVRSLAAGLRFSQDVGKGGSLFATLIAKDLVVNHLRATVAAIHLEHLASVQRSQLREAVARLGEGLDWQNAARRDLEALRGNFAADTPASSALADITKSYVECLRNPSNLSRVQETINRAPRELTGLIPNPTKVLEQKQDLTNMLLEARAILQ